MRCKYITIQLWFYLWKFEEVLQQKRFATKAMNYTMFAYSQFHKQRGRYYDLSEPKSNINFKFALWFKFAPDAIE